MSITLDDIDKALDEYNVPASERVKDRYIKAIDHLFFIERRITANNWMVLVYDIGQRFSAPVTSAVTAYAEALRKTL